MSEKATETRATLPVCIVNSLPKSGTHLLKKIISQFPGMVAGDLHLGPRRSLVETDGTDDAIPIGVGRPRMMSRARMRSTLKGLKAGSVVTGHLPYAEGMASLLRELSVKMVSIIRDPRDVAVSQVNYVLHDPENPLRGHYQELSESERIMAAIVGIRQQGDGPVLLNLRERLESVLRWRIEPQNRLTSFERLVGPHGGGSRTDQVQEIDAIARHLGLNLAAQEIESVADAAFGGTATFSGGVIGRWREHFTEEHKRACKELVGELLIELGYERDLKW